MGVQLWPDLFLFRHILAVQPKVVSNTVLPAQYLDKVQFLQQAKELWSQEMQILVGIREQVAVPACL
jgi:hypothetical protein